MVHFFLETMSAISFPDINAWFAELDRFTGIPFMEDGRRQPPMPEPEELFET